MLADSSTPSGARSTARRRERDAIAKPFLEDSGERHRLIEMVRLGLVPRHQLDVAQAAAEGRHAVDAGERAGHRGGVEGRVVNGCAGGGRPERRVRVQADEEIGFVVVGDGGAIVERQLAIVVAREQDANAEPRLDGGLDAAGDRERQVLLFRAAGAFHAFVGAAMARIDRNRLNGGDRGVRVRAEGRGTAAAGREAGAAGLAGEASDAAAITSIVRRIVVSTGSVVARNPATRGPRSTPSVVASTTRTLRTRLCGPCGASGGLSMSSASASNLIRDDRCPRSPCSRRAASRRSSGVRRAPRDRSGPSRAARGGRRR